MVAVVIFRMNKNTSSECDAQKSSSFLTFSGVQRRNNPRKTKGAAMKGVTFGIRGLGPNPTYGSELCKGKWASGHPKP